MCFEGNGGSILRRGFPSPASRKIGSPSRYYDASRPTSSAYFFRVSRLRFEARMDRSFSEHIVTEALPCRVKKPHRLTVAWRLALPFCCTSDTNCSAEDEAGNILSNFDLFPGGTRPVLPVRGRVRPTRIPWVGVTDLPYQIPKRQRGSELQLIP